MATQTTQTRPTREEVVQWMKDESQGYTAALKRWPSLNPSTTKSWWRRYVRDAADTVDPEVKDHQSSAQVGEYVNIDSLVPWNRNPRLNAPAVPGVMRSLVVFGFGRPLIAWQREGARRLVVGHTTMAAYLRLLADSAAGQGMWGPGGAFALDGPEGEKTVANPQPDWCPGGLPEGAARGVAPVRWRDDWTEEEATGYAIADNKTAEVSAWDELELGKILDELDETADFELGDMGFGDEDLSALLGTDPPKPPPPAPAPPPLQRVVHSARGEVYELGPHRLICGDSLDEGTWSALLRGVLLQAVWTDPPYGVAYVGKTREALTIQNDAMDEDALSRFWGAVVDQLIANTRPGASWYVAAPAGPLNLVFGGHLKRVGVLRQQLVWMKDVFVLGRSDYHYKHEPIFYGWSPGAAHYFIDDRTQDSIHEVPRPKVSKDHPTMKPVELIERHLLNSTHPGDLVGDPFGGSGSTLLAAARIGRVARLVELDPKYCDVIRRRWTAWAADAGVEPGTGALE